MSDQYCVNKNAQSTGEHEVHNVTANCSYLPNLENRVNLGSHANCHGAVLTAKAYYPIVNGGAYCCSECNTG